MSIRNRIKFHNFVLLAEIIATKKRIGFPILFPGPLGPHKLNIFNERINEFELIHLNSFNTAFSLIIEIALFISIKAITMFISIKAIHSIHFFRAVRPASLIP